MEKALFFFPQLDILSLHSRGAKGPQVHRILAIAEALLSQDNIFQAYILCSEILDWCSKVKGPKSVA
jgi:hypothetical protein